MTKLLMFALTSAFRPKTVILGMVLFAALLGFSQGADAATAYYVDATDVYVRSKPQSYAMGRLYNHTNTGQGRMDIQYVDSNGWGYGYAYGYVNRCVWAQYSYRRTDGSYAVNFRTNGTAVSDKCRTSNIYLDTSEFTNGEIFMNSSNTDGVMVTLPRGTHMWDNWLWTGAWGNSVYRGYVGPGSIWKVRYTTKDGVGTMARPCVTRGTGAVECLSDWYFIQRSSF
ncbi:MAG: hypothetical protein WKF92_13480 [Pyrinomonadaceae bacterium]